MTHNPVALFQAAQAVLALVAISGVLPFFKARKLYRDRPIGRTLLYGLAIWLLVGPLVVLQMERSIRSHYTPIQLLQHSPIIVGPLWHFYLVNAALVALALWLLALLGRRHAT